MSTTLNNNTMLARAGMGSIQGSLWRNEHENGATMNVSLTKSYYDRKEGQLKKQTCSLSPTELAASIQVLQDIQAQMLEQSRSFETESDE